VAECPEEEAVTLVEAEEVAAAQVAAVAVAEVAEVVVAEAVGAVEARRAPVERVSVVYRAAESAHLVVHPV